MTKSAQEILAEWADPETGGTMPPEVREAALSVLKEAKRETQYREAAEAVIFMRNGELARSEARVKELEAALKRIDAIACEHGRGAIVEAQGVARSVLKPKP